MSGSGGNQSFVSSAEKMLPWTRSAARVAAQPPRPQMQAWPRKGSCLAVASSYSLHTNGKQLVASLFQLHPWQGPHQADRRSAGLQD